MVLQRVIIRLLPVEILLIGVLVVAWTLGQVEFNLPAPIILPADDAAQPALAAEAVPPTAAGLSPIFTAEVQRWADKIVAWAGLFGLDPNLVATVMQIESCGWPGAVSTSNAQGLFQVMPFHFEAGEAMQDPDTNAGRGLAYLALSLTRADGDVGRALAGYNGGHSLIGRDPSLWPEQTRRYWYWGTGIYTEASSGAATSVRLEEWKSAGGASLCARAAAAAAP
jgi:soluble lytic murein transglycosylase-like protein